MSHLIQQDNVFEGREWRLGKEVVYHVVLLCQFDDKEAMGDEEDVPTETEGQGLTWMIVKSENT